MIVITGMIFNTAAKTWHPVLFRDAPLPGPDGYKLGRVKSFGHHTAGFATREEADRDVIEHPELQGVPFDREFVYEWDGEGIPALVAFAAEGKLIAL